MNARPPPAAGDPSPVWPLLDRTPKVAADSFMRTRVSKKTGVLRYHAGMDLPAPRGTVVLATEGGEVVRLQSFNGAHAHALLLQTDTGLVINFGEVEPDSWTALGVGKGSRVFKGQPIARVGINPAGGEMLHFETYRDGTRKTASWVQGEPPPVQLLDPTDYILRAAKRPVVSGQPVEDDGWFGEDEDARPAPAPAPSPRPQPPRGGSVWPLLLAVLFFLARRTRADR